MCLLVSYKKENIWKIFFCIPKVTEERSGSSVTDPRIRIRTKMLRIPNTA
jgi:hypothetical protein